MPALANRKYIDLYFIFLQSVAQKGERIAEEEVKCQHMADLAQADLKDAMPALEEAMKVMLFYIHLLCIQCCWLI